MHLVTRESSLLGVPSAFEITWAPCRCPDAHAHDDSRTMADLLLPFDMPSLEPHPEPAF